MENCLFKEKDYKNLDFTDDFIFCKILTRNPELCKELLELIIGKKVKKIVFTQNQEAIQITADGKGILPKRTRYYQGMIDLNIIEKGDDYNKLRKTYIIFIGTFDYFNKGMPVYTFTNRCKEVPELELGDDSIKIFVNPHGKSEHISPQLRSFLKFVATKEVTDDFTKKLDEEVRRAQSNQEWEVEYMTLLMRDRENQEIGERNKEIQMAKNMFHKGATFEFVKACTTILTDDELLEIQKMN